MNVLITSVGRRAYIVKYFQEVLRGNGKVHVSNSDDKTVAFKYADASIITPLIYDKEYIPFLLDYCKNNKIDFIISLFDIDLLILSRNKNRFSEIGTKVIVSSPEFVEICNDKWKTYLFLRENAFNTPKTYIDLETVKNDISEGKLNYPLIVKPRFGCGSISINVADTEKDLDYLYEKTKKAVEESYLKYESYSYEKKVVIQEKLNGQEYGADIINDLYGNTRAVVLRKKIAMRSGETDIAELIDDDDMKSILRKLGNKTKHIANLDCDFFKVNDIIYILEMNARFGGGYPFSHMGGCNLPLAIIKWVIGEDVSNDELEVKHGLLGFKEIYITEG